MFNPWRIGILITGIFLLAAPAFAQYVTVEKITVNGIKRTRPPIVYRELTFAEGDTLQQKDLGPILERNRNNLLNLGIFNEVVVNISEWDTEKNTVDIIIEIKESWYIYAVPILDLADRNFNVWWTTYNHSLDRLNLGARLEWLNVTGWNDKLKAKIQFGYTPKQDLEYRFPYLNRRQSLGITTGFSHSINKEISYATLDNQEQFIQLNERKLAERWQSQVTTVYRPNIFAKYELGIGYQYIKVDQEIVNDYNPYYFSNGDSTQSVFSMRALFEYDDRDFKLFPSSGIKVAIEAEKIGFGRQADENAMITNVTGEWNATTGRRFQHRISMAAKYSISRDLPSYVYYRGLGSSKKYVAGYELFIVDGLDFVLGKYQLAYTLVNRQSDLGKMMPVQQFRRVSYAVYLSLLLETGYVNDPYTSEGNPLANQWLYGGGPAVTVLLYNNFLFQFSYCGNAEGEWGFFIHNRTSF